MKYQVEFSMVHTVKGYGEISERRFYEEFVAKDEKELMEKANHYAKEKSYQDDDEWYDCIVMDTFEI